MNKTILSSLLAIAAAAPIASQAADGTITFNGNITSQTCTINGGANPADIAVTMPTVSASSLPSAGKTAGVVADSIKIALTACTKTSSTPATNGFARAFFEAGPTVDSITRRLINSNGTATNVQVGVINQDGSDVAIGAASGAQNTQWIALSNAGAATLVYGSKYVATGAVVQGTVKTTVQYSIEYQ
jgi:major type 1 subunit fimbrin (pilin)